MGTTQINIYLGTDRMRQLATLKKRDGEEKISDDTYAKELLLKKMDEKLMEPLPKKKVQ